MQYSEKLNQVEDDRGREQTRTKIYGDILDKIVTGELAAGQRLKEAYLAQTYKVSRTPIREILIALEKDGLVERIRNRGAKVISFTPDDVEQLYDLRSALERLAVRCATPHMPLNQLLEFEQRLVALLGSPGPRQGEHLNELDFELHRFIIFHSRNRRLVKYLENMSLLPHSLSVRLAGYQDDERSCRSGQEHLMIVRALLRRDSQLAERLLAEHIERGKRLMLELIYQRPAVA